MQRTLSVGADHQWHSAGLGKLLIHSRGLLNCAALCLWLQCTYARKGEKVMSTTLKSADIRFRIESDLKDNAVEVLNNCGLTISEAMRLFLRQVVATQGVPFDIRVPSAKTQRAMQEAAQIEQRFDSMEAAFEALDEQK